MIARTWCTTLAIVLATTSVASAAGRWNMPTRPLQWLGVGYGQGYHAPMLLGPAIAATPANPGIDRLPAPLTVACPQGCACFDAGPSTLNGPVYYAPQPIVAAPAMHYPQPAQVAPPTAPRPTSPPSPSDRPGAPPLPLPKANVPVNAPATPAPLQQSFRGGRFPR